MYVLNKIIIAVISPFGTALILGVLAWVAVAVKRRKLAAWLGGAALAWACFWSLPWVSYLIRSHLESAYPPQAVRAVPAAEAIIVLGGAVSPPHRKRPTFDLSGAADRVWHAHRLFNAGKAPLIVLSGGHDPDLSLVSEADAMATWLVEAGIPTEALLLETKSRTTVENAAFTAPILRERKIQRVLLVTSATHMARAMPLFQAQGLDVVPVATDHEATPPPPGLLGFIPDAGALAGSAGALKEIVGRLRGP